MQTNSPSPRLTLFFLILLISFSSKSHCDDLEDFEEAATESSSSPSDWDDSDGSYGGSYSDDDDQSFGEALAEELLGALFQEMFRHLIVMPGAYSFYRAGAPFDSTGPWVWNHGPHHLRSRGDYLLPVFQADFSLGGVNYDIAHTRVRLESGFGGIAAQYNANYFLESHSQDQLFVQSLVGIYRMGFTPYFTFGIGGGVASIHGDGNHFGPSFRLGTNLSPHRNVSLFYRWGYKFFENSGMSDKSIGMLFRLRTYSISLSYNHFKASPEEIQGLGVGIHYSL